MAGERTVKIRFGGDARGLTRAAQQGEQAMGRWQKGVSAAGEKARLAALAAGAAVGAALAAGVGAGLEQSKAHALLAAQLGATGDQAANLGQAAGRLYARGVVGSVEESTAAVKAAVQNALVPPNAAGAAIDKVAGKIANLATVMEEDADRVSSAVSQMIRTGMVKSAQEGFDLLQKGVEKGVNKSQDLLDTMNEYGTQFRKLGLDGPKAMGLLSQAIQAGARDSDVAADALKEFALRAADGSKSSAEGFEAIGLNAKKMTAIFAKGGPEAAEALDTVLDRIRAMKDPTEREAAAVALFGTKAEDLQGALWAMDPSSATKALGEVAGASDQAGKSLEESAGAKVEALKRKLQQGLIQALASTAGWVERNSTLVKTLAMVLGPLVVIVGTIIAVTKIWTAVQTVLNIVMSANPIALVIIGVAALIAIIVLIATKTTWFQTAWKVAWSGIQAALKAWWAYAKWVFGLIVSAIGWVKDRIVAGIQGAIAIFKAWQSGVGKVKDWIVEKLTALVSWVKDMPGRIKNGLGKLSSILSAPFKAAFNSIARLWNGTVGRLSFTAPSWVPGLSGKGFSMPQLPMLAQGGIVRATRGGTLAVIGEGGQDEAVAPLPRLATMIEDAVRAAGPTAPAGPPTIHVEARVFVGDREITDIVRVEIADRDRQVRRRVTAGSGRAR